MKHLFTLVEIPNEEVLILLDVAKRFAEGMRWRPNREIFVANLFFENSTRTKCSFHMAEQRLGLQTIPFSAESSSIQKGETLYDTVVTLQSIGVDLVVVRHEEEHYFEPLRHAVSIPIINAGDGCGHHPTQSLLDLLTIRQQFGVFAGITVSIVGDIRHSRVARSNAEMLTRLGATVLFASPPIWKDETNPFGTYVTLDEAIQQSDVVMLLRIQHERHHDKGMWTKEQYHEQYGLTVRRASQMKSRAIIMHPAPFNRDVEIASELIECKRSRIFKQMENGVYVKMAVLKRSIEAMDRLDL